MLARIKINSTLLSLINGVYFILSEMCNLLSKFVLIKRHLVFFRASNHNCFKCLISKASQLSKLCFSPIFNSWICLTYLLHHSTTLAILTLTNLKKLPTVRIHIHITIVYNFHFSVFVIFSSVLPLLFCQNFSLWLYFRLILNPRTILSG